MISLQIRLAIGLQRVIVLCMMVLFLIQAYRALKKYADKDTMMVTELEEPEKQIFPSVTICKGYLRVRGSDTGLEEAFEFNSLLDNWLEFVFDTKE